MDRKEIARKTMDLLMQSGALVPGHFVFRSHKHGDTFVDADAIGQRPTTLSWLGKQLADRLWGNVDAEVIVGFGPIGFALAQWTAFHYRAEPAGGAEAILTAFIEDEYKREQVGIDRHRNLTADPLRIVAAARTHHIMSGEKTFRASQALVIDGRRVVLIKPVVMTGISVRASMRVIESFGGKCAGVGTLWNCDNCAAEFLDLPDEAFCALINDPLQLADYPCPLCRQGQAISMSFGEGIAFCKVHPRYPALD